MSDKYCIESIDEFETVFHLKMLDIPIDEHKMSFLLFEMS